MPSGAKQAASDTFSKGGRFMTAFVFALHRVGARQSGLLAPNTAKRMAATASWSDYRGDLTGTRTC